MKIMNILVISLVVIAVSLFLFDEKTSAQVAIDGGDVVIMNVRKGYDAADDILVYHKSSKSFLLYGYSGSKGKGLQLLQVRNLVNDFDLAEGKKGKLELKFKKNGYEPSTIKSKVKY